MQTITFALAKGELLKAAVELLTPLGIDFSQFLDPANRLLRITSPTSPDGYQYAALLVRNSDVPVYVEYGQAQLGIVGYDVVREKSPQVAHLVDLKFGACRLSVAVTTASGYQRALDLPPQARVASKFVHCAAAYFEDLDLPVEIIPLYGSVELAPITGMAEAIVDLVATGRTLKDNGLIELDCIFHSTARLIAHPLSYRTRHLDAVVQQIRDAVANRSLVNLRP